MNGILPNVNALRQLVAQAAVANTQPPLPPVVHPNIVAVRAHAGEVLVELSDLLGEIRRTIREHDVREALGLAERLDERITDALEEITLELVRAQGNQPWIDELIVCQQGFTALAAPIQALLLQLQPMDRRIREELGEQVVHGVRGQGQLFRHGGFGRPGLAPLTTFAILLQWTVAGLVYLALGVILRTWYPWAFNDGDIRWTSAFIVGGTILLTIAATLALAAIRLAAASLRYGLGLVVWGARLFLRPAIQALPVITDENIEQFLRDDLGIPVDRWANTLDTVLIFPIGVSAGMLGLLLTQHSLGYVGFLVMDALVLLLGYVFIVYTTGIRNQRIFNAIVIGHFILAIGQFLLWLFGPMVSLEWLICAGAVALVLPILLSKLFIAGMIAIAVLTGWLSSRMEGKRATILFVIALLFGVLGGGAALIRSQASLSLLGASTVLVCTEERNRESVRRALTPPAAESESSSGASATEGETSLLPNGRTDEHVAAAGPCTRMPGAPNQCPSPP